MQSSPRHVVMLANTISRDEQFLGASFVLSLRKKS